MYQEIEEKLNASKLINFLPYVGPKYLETKNKILVLGESHYGAQDKNTHRNFTRDVVEDDYLSAVSEGKLYPWIKCYRNTAATITGEGYHESDYIWKELTFYNFFQEVVGDENAADKKFITPELIEKSRKAFFETLAILNPKIVIVWGESKMYWTWLPQESRIVLDADKMLFSYKNLPSTLIWSIQHPSRCFSYDRFNKEWESIKTKYLVI